MSLRRIYLDTELSVEDAKFLAALLEDESIPRHAGREMPTADLRPLRIMDPDEMFIDLSKPKGPKMVTTFCSTPKTALFGSGLLEHFGVGFPALLTFLAHHFGNEGSQQVSEAVAKVMAAGVPWAKILGVLLPLVLSLFTGGSLDLAAIVAAILKLLPITPSS